MSCDQLQMNKSEASLLENVDAVVKLLNVLVLKDNISSEYVLRRLDYLYNRLGDFLVRDSCGDWEPTERKSADSLRNYDLWEQADDELVARKNKSESAMNMGAVGNIEYECGLCQSSITMYNSDHKLSMDLHCQEDSHQQALQLQKIKAAKTAAGTEGPISSQHEKVVAVNQTNKKEGLKYISQISDKRLYCSLCGVHLSSLECAHQHVTGSAHRKELVASQRDWSEAGSEMVTTGKGVYWCPVCDVHLGSSSNAIQHRRGKAHLQKLAARQLVPQKEDKFWLKIPEGWRNHKQYFQNLGDVVLQCTPCMANVPMTYTNVLSHIRGKKHLNALSGDM